MWATDLDRDGTIDILAATANLPAALELDEIAWWEHRGGQFSLETSDVSKGVLEEEMPSALLEIKMTHNGLPGEQDIELTSLELLFEASTDDPLDPATAAELIETLAVYRDNPLQGRRGGFDNADSLVEEVTDLSLIRPKTKSIACQSSSNIRVKSPRGRWRSSRTCLPMASSEVMCRHGASITQARTI